LRSRTALKSWVIFDADDEDFTGNEVVARGFFGIEMADGSLDIGIGETEDWQVKLIWGP
jgi:hypothetical protein